MTKYEKDIKYLINDIARYMVITGYRETLSGNYIFYFDEISNVFNIPFNLVRTLSKRIACVVESYKKVSDVELYNESFDINFYGDFNEYE